MGKHIYLGVQYSQTNVVAESQPESDPARRVLASEGGSVAGQAERFLGELH